MNIRAKNKHITGPALVKFIRDGSLDFWRWFVYSVTSRADTPSWQSRRPLRKTKRNVKAWKYRIDGIVPAVGKPLYDAKAKEGFSKPQSTTYCHIDNGLAPPIFHHDRVNTLVGVRLGIESAKITRITSVDIGSVGRGYALFSTKEEAEKHFEKEYADKRILKDLKELEDIKKNDKHNEVMARLKWENDDSSQIRIFANNMPSRLLAQLRAHDLQRRLKSKTAIPISAQLSVRSKVSASDYEEKTQQEDLKEVIKQDAKQAKNSKPPKKTEEFYLARFIYLNQHDFDKDKTEKAIQKFLPDFKFDVSFEDILEYTTLASHLTYETSHLFFTHLQQRLTSITELTKKLSVYQWKELFDCIHPDQCDPFFDAILKNTASSKDKAAILSRVSAGYIACLVDRNSELFNNRIIELLRCLDGTDLNAPFPDVQTFFYFVALSGNLTIAKKMILGYQKEIRLDKKIVYDRESHDLHEMTHMYRFDGLSMLLQHLKAKDVISREHLAGTDVIDVLQTGDYKAGKQLIQAQGFAAYDYIVELCTDIRENVSLLIFICHRYGVLDCALKHVKSTNNIEMIFILTFLKTIKWDLVGFDSLYSESHERIATVESAPQLLSDVMLYIAGKPELLLQMFTMDFSGKSFLDIVLELEPPRHWLVIKALIVNSEINLLDKDIVRLRALVDKEGGAELFYIFKAFRDSLTNYPWINAVNNYFNVKIKVLADNETKEYKYSAKMPSELKWENNASTKIFFTEDYINQARLFAQLCALELRRTLKISDKNPILLLGISTNKDLFIYDEAQQAADFYGALSSCDQFQKSIAQIMLFIMNNFNVSRSNLKAIKSHEITSYNIIHCLKITSQLSSEISNAFFSMVEKRYDFCKIVEKFLAEDYRKLFSYMPIEKTAEYFLRFCNEFKRDDDGFLRRLRDIEKASGYFSTKNGEDLFPWMFAGDCIKHVMKLSEEFVNAKKYDNNAYSSASLFTAICLGYVAFLIQSNSDKSYLEIEKILSQKLLTEEDAFSVRFTSRSLKRAFIDPPKTENLIKLAFLADNKGAIQVLMKFFGTRVIEEVLEVPTSDRVELLLTSARHALQPIQLFYLLVAANSWPALKSKLNATFRDSRLDVGITYVEEKCDWRKFSETAPKLLTCYTTDTKNLKSKLLMQIRKNDLQLKHNLTDTSIIFTDAKASSLEKIFLYSKKSQQDDVIKARRSSDDAIKVMGNLINYQENHNNSDNVMLDALSKHTAFSEFLSIVCDLSYVTSHALFLNLIIEALKKVGGNLNASQWQNLFNCINPAEREAYFTRLKKPYLCLATQAFFGISNPRNAEAKIIVTEDNIQSRLFAKLRALDLEFISKNHALIRCIAKDKSLSVYDEAEQLTDFNEALRNPSILYYITHVIFFIMDGFKIPKSVDMIRKWNLKVITPPVVSNIPHYLKIICFLSRELRNTFFAMLEKVYDLDKLVKRFSAEGCKNLFSCMPVEKTQEYFLQLSNKVNLADAKASDRNTRLDLGYAAFLIQSNSDQSFAEFERILSQKLLTEKDVLSPKFQRLTLTPEDNFLSSPQSETLMDLVNSVGNKGALQLLTNYFKIDAKKSTSLTLGQ